MVDTIYLCLEWDGDDFIEVGFAWDEDKAYLWRSEGEELTLLPLGQKIWSRDVMMLSPISTKAEDEERARLVKEFLEED